MTTDRPLVGALLLPTGPWDDLVARAQEAERIGFDFVWLDDHAVHPARPATPWFELWTALAGLAGATRTVTLGPLVSNAVLRHPVMLARQARTVEQLAGGRLEVALGASYAPSDHAALGGVPWSAAERSQRFAEAVALVDALLRGDETTFVGIHYSVDRLTLAPAPITPPRPPLAVAAHGPRAIEVAARHAEVWVSYGGFELEPDETLALTKRRVERLERACEAIGRDPATIGRRILAGSAALTREPIWSSADAFDGFVARHRAIGIDQLAFHYPPERVNPPGTVREGAVAEALARLKG
jgi:alkanesulfonate monooxygenase SsuD/methylene tetrahydromethanopterin reductase-like flavin-dependent oxidoreductase (luciferase family)